MLTYKPAEANPDGTTSVKIISTITPSSLWPAKEKIDHYAPWVKEEEGIDQSPWVEED